MKNAPVHPPGQADHEIEPVTGLTWKVYRETIKRQAAAEKVNGDPAPGPLAGAFLPEKLEHLGIEIREMQYFDILLLKKLDSPLFRRLKELSKPIGERKPAPFTDEEGFEMVFQFTHDIFEVQKLILRGREVFLIEATRFVLELAKSKVKDPGNSFREIPDFIHHLEDLCVANFIRSMDTHVRYAPPDSPDSPKLPPPDSRTESAGGSRMSPSSSATST